MQKIIYFTAGPIATVGEEADIAALNAVAAKPFEVAVRNGAIPAEYQPNLEDTDYVAGTIPEAYDDAETYPVFDVDAPPTPDNLPATQAIVSNAEEIVIGPTTYTFTVVDNVITNIVAAP